MGEVSSIGATSVEVELEVKALHLQEQAMVVWSGLGEDSSVGATSEGVALEAKALYLGERVTGD